MRIRIIESIYRDWPAFALSGKMSDPDGAKPPEGRCGHRGQIPFPQLLCCRGIITLWKALAMREFGSKSRAVRLYLLFALATICATPPQVVSAVEPEMTRPLSTTTDLASDMVDGIDRFLLKEIDDAAARRGQLWQVDLASDAALQASLQTHRESLARMIGAHDPRIAVQPIDETNVDLNVSAIIGTSNRFDVHAMRWPVLAEATPTFDSLPSLFGEGIVLLPRERSPANATIIVIPDADQTPEQISGLVTGISPQSQTARRLAEMGYRVYVPAIVSRQREPRGGRANLTDREYLHRPTFELGRTLAGYEVQMVLALVDRIKLESPQQRVGVFGYGEGGLIGLFAGAVDTRIDSVCISGFFGPRQKSWNEPIDRNFFGMFTQFDATELAMLMASRTFVVETSRGPEVVLSGDGGTPAELKTPDRDAASELLVAATKRLPASAVQAFTVVHPEVGGFGTEVTLGHFIAGLQIATNATIGIASVSSLSPIKSNETLLVQANKNRRQRMNQHIDRHSQGLLKESQFVREQFMSKLNTQSIETYEESVKPYRDTFRHEVIGHFDQPLLSPNTRSRQKWETDKWIGYEITMDVFPDVFAYGALLLPKDLKPGERRPVVVCQHGLEGRPTDTFEGDHPAYHDFASKLCDNGLIVFAPQNPYLFQDRFRALQRKAQPIGKTLFSIIVPQHQQIVNWLKTQSYTDPERIAFYGLSYGGKTAMRVPALVTDYCLSICSADFNEWVLKNASSRHRFSYLWTGEYEIYEWNLGSTFNYAEMAALICPRPFMVERGHFDGVGEDHWVAFEYAKVRNLYAAKLGIPERAEIEWFVGPHTINGRGSFAFLSRHLNWPISPIDQPAAVPTSTTPQ